jgi:pyruvate/2-oxoglutarate dehydrogenase complex dihydrolipoamide acyltransferase (E2) component
VVRELGIIHLVIEFETYKTTFGIISQAMGIIIKALVKVGGV